MDSGGRFETGGSHKQLWSELEEDRGGNEESKPQPN